MNQMVMRKEKKGAAPVFPMARSRGSVGIGGDRQDNQDVDSQGDENVE